MPNTTIGDTIISILPSISLPLMATITAIGLTLIYASHLDLRSRRVPHRIWRPALIIALPAIIWIYGQICLTDPRVALIYFPISIITCAVLLCAAIKNFFGGADAYALIIITLCIPFVPWLGICEGFFPRAVLGNTVIMTLIVPIMVLAKNLIQGNKAPMPYLFTASPVPSTAIQNEFGHVVEDIEEQDGRLVRRFISFSEYSRRRLEGDRITTIEDLTAHPEHYGDKLDLYQKAGHVWISHSIPFIVLITAGYFSALIAGDLLGALILTLVETIL